MTNNSATTALIDALRDCKAALHYFLCHSINGHPSVTDDGTCRGYYCVEVRQAMETLRQLVESANL